MNRLELSSIEAIGPATYKLVLLNADEIVTFQMKVEGDDVKVVKWQDDFTRCVDFNTGPLELIFKAVLAFHLARQVLFPPSRRATQE